MAQVLWRKKANLTQIWPVRNQKWFFFFVEKVLPMNLYYFQWKLFIYWFQRVIHSALQHIYFIYWYNIIIRAWLWSWWRELKIWRNCCRHQQALTIKLLFIYLFLTLGIWSEVSKACWRNNWQKNCIVHESHLSVKNRSWLNECRYEFLFYFILLLLLLKEVLGYSYI